MLYHNIMVSDDQRLAKEVLEQQIDEEHEESFANQVREEAAALGITQMKDLTKSELKKKVKEAVKGRMVEEVKREVEESSKMRFIVPGNVFEQAEYVGELPGDEVVEVLKVRLNMVNIHGNYKNDLTKRRFCPHCMNEKDTTEHLIRCPAIGDEETWEKKDLVRTDASSWRGIMNTIRKNVETRMK